MNIEIILDTKDDSFHIPINNSHDSFQMRSDGILVNGKLYFWEVIHSVYICNMDNCRRVKDENRIP